MRKVLAAALTTGLIAAAVVAGAQGSSTAPTLMRPDGRPVPWQGWLEEHGPAAVLVWASWAPRSADVLAGVGRLEAVSRRLGLELVLVDVQEPIDDARSALAGVEVRWLHDRHGAILRHHRVIRVPWLVVVAADGSVTGSTAPSSEALARWHEGRGE